jgi:predicted glycosyltransferase
MSQVTMFVQGVDIPIQDLIHYAESQKKYHKTLYDKLKNQDQPDKAGFQWRHMQKMEAIEKVLDAVYVRGLREYAG